MTPQEKAKELVKKHTNYFGLDSDDVNEEKAKNSALITVDEIITLLFSDYKSELFYQQVRQEIEKL